MILIEKIAADADQTYKKFQAGIVRDSERDSIQGKNISKEVNAREEGPGICGESVMDMILKKQVNA